MSDKQRTIKSAVTVSGVGLHTGAEVHLTYKPAPENHGYKFKRIDLEGQPIVEASLDNVVDTSDYNGEDVYVSEEDMQTLLDTINKVIKASKLVKGQIENGYKLGPCDKHGWPPWVAVPQDLE